MSNRAADPDREPSAQLFVIGAQPKATEKALSPPTSRGGRGKPEWSPDGKLIAFTWRFGDTRRIGVISPDGTGEQTLTRGPADEGPSWAASRQPTTSKAIVTSGRRRCR